jgi:hypothetical protein
MVAGYSLDNIGFIEDSHGKKTVILFMEAYKTIQEQLEELEDMQDCIKVNNNKVEHKIVM